MDDPKAAVRDFWDAASCGEVYAEGESLADQFEAHSRRRYELEPYLKPFARFEDGAGLDVLEIGVGMGADHVEWARSRPRRLVGIDITPRGVDWTRQRLRHYGFDPDVAVGDAERLEFPDESFDLVYSWGVLHHTPNTRAALAEVHRVLRNGGRARVLMYHKWSIVGLLLWLRFALFVGKPRRPLSEIYSEHLESPGTQAFTVAEVKAMTRQFRSCKAWAGLSMGDLLDGAVGQRYAGGPLAVLKLLWPRPLIRRFGRRLGLALFVELVK